MKKTNRILPLILTLVLFAVAACSGPEEDEDQGNWVLRSFFEGDSRGNSSVFSISGRHFVVGGYTGDDYLADLWEYLPDTDSWVRRADFPGTPRANAVGFALDGKGYYGTGYDGRNRLKDFWSYDPETDQWTALADFPGTARYNAVGFGINGRGFIGTGYDGSDEKDFFVYSPQTDSWEALPSFGGAKRQGAFYFILGNNVYLGGGSNNGLYQNDFWQLDGNTLAWTRKTDLDEEDEYTMARFEAVGFSLNDYGYVAVGSNGQLIGSTWEYLPASDTWNELTEFEGSLRLGASVFYDNRRAFVLLGRNSSLRFDDIWEFKPLEIYEEED